MPCAASVAGMIDDVHTFSPTMVGNLRVGFNRYRAYYQQNSLGFDPTPLGFPSYIAANATQLLMPAFTFSDGFLVASPVTNLHLLDQPYNTYQLFGSLNQITGRHTLKFGGEHRVLDFSNFGLVGIHRQLHLRQHLGEGQLHRRRSPSRRLHGGLPARAAHQRQLHHQQRLQERLQIRSPLPAGRLACPPQPHHQSRPALGVQQPHHANAGTARWSDSIRPPPTR